MTISSINRKAGPYAGNGVATAFPFSFKVFSAADVYAVRADSTGNETDLTLTTDYTVSLNADQNANPGGTLTLLAPLAYSYSLTITSKLDYLQPTDLTNNGGFYPKVISNALDRLTIFCQQLYEQLSRSLKLAISVPPGVKVTLPVPVPYQVLGWDSTGTEIVNADPTYATSLSADLATASDTKGSVLVGFKQLGTGAASRTVQDKERDAVSVKDFGAVGDGITSDQAAVAAAVAHCKLTGERLYWPAGTYLSTANIPDFHGVRHVGQGVVKRGSELFQVSLAGSSVNNVYVSASGSASNDGLSSSQPISESAIPNVLANYGPLLDGVWRFYLAAGTYTGGLVITGVRSKNYLEFYGASVGGHPNVPTSIVDGAGSSSDHGWFFQDRMTVKVQDIKFQNWTTKAYSHGLCAVGHSKLYTVNVHSFNVNYGGIDVEDHSNLILGGGIHNNTGYSIRATYHSTVSLGYGGSAGANRPQIFGATTGNAGVWLTEYSQGHIDYCNIYGCNASGGGVQLTNHSRADINYTTFGGAPLGGGANQPNYYNLRADTMSTFIDNAGNVWNTPTIKSIVLLGGSIDWANNNNVFCDSATGYMRLGPSTSYSPGAPLHVVASQATTGYNSATVLALEGATNSFLSLGSNGTGEAGTFVTKGVTSNAWGKWNYTFSDDTWRLWNAGANTFQFGTTYFVPIADNTKSLGSSLYRWTTVYAATGAINTSDARTKQQIMELSEQERAVAIRLKSLVRTFKFNDAVEAKGDKARIHVGVIAQEVKSAFEAEGLVAEDYAILCYDEWPEQQEVVETWDDEFDEDGSLRRPAGSRILEPYRPAGNRYGVRYDEFLAFILGATVNA